MLKVVTLMLAAALTLPAAIIFSENFENGVAIQAQTTGVLEGTQFRMVSGSIDIVTPTSPYASNCTTPTAGTCIDTTGGSNLGRGVIETINEIHLAPGEYFLSFDLIGWFYAVTNYAEQASVRVTFGDLFDQVYVRNGNNNPYPTINELLVVDEATSARLVFQTLTGPAYAGVILDNIEIRTAFEENVAHAPEPGTWALIALGGGLLALQRMRRRQAAQVA